jgi:hypothetical protein
MDASMMTGPEIKILQDAVHRLEDEVDQKSSLIEELEKKIYNM